MKIVSLLSCKLYGPLFRMRGNSVCHSPEREHELILSSAPMLRSTLRVMDTVDMALPFLQGFIPKISDRQPNMKQIKLRGKSRNKRYAI